MTCGFPEELLPMLQSPRSPIYLANDGMTEYASIWASDLRVGPPVISVYHAYVGHFYPLIEWDRKVHLLCKWPEVLSPAHSYIALTQLSYPNRTYWAFIWSFKRVNSTSLLIRGKWVTFFNILKICISTLHEVVWQKKCPFYAALKRLPNHHHPQQGSINSHTIFCLLRVAWYGMSLGNKSISLLLRYSLVAY